MEKAEAPAIDKTGWPPGPWDAEPDRVDFVHAGYACLILRHPHLGFLCAYVGVDERHPWFGRDWGNLDELPPRVNYANVCSGRVCHVPEPGMPERVWWFGMDYGHAFETGPGALAVEARFADKLGPMPEVPGFEEHYVPLPAVRRDVERLAEALRAKAAANG